MAANAAPVNRSAMGGPIAVTVVPGDFAVRPEVHLLTLAGETMYDQNTEGEPERIVPHESRAPVRDGRVGLSLAPFSLVRLTFDLALT